MEYKLKPAFPANPARPWDNESAGGYLGLTKREYFAAIAMQGLLSNPEWMKEYKGEKYLMQSDIVADVALKHADALLDKLAVEPEREP